MVLSFALGMPQQRIIQLKPWQLYFIGFFRARKDLKYTYVTLDCLSKWTHSRVQGRQIDWQMDRWCRGSLCVSQSNVVKHCLLGLYSAAFWPSDISVIYWHHLSYVIDCHNSTFALLCTLHIKLQFFLPQRTRPTEQDSRLSKFNFRSSMHSSCKTAILSATRNKTYTEQDSNLRLSASISDDLLTELCGQSVPMLWRFLYLLHLKQTTTTKNNSNLGFSG